MSHLDVIKNEGTISMWYQWQITTEARVSGKIYILILLKGLAWNFPLAQMVEHGTSNAKIMGSIPRESKSWSNVKTVTWMQCKSLWIKASAKCINVNVNVKEVSYAHEDYIYLIKNTVKQ